MRWPLACCLLLAACARRDPVLDPLDYLRIGVDPNTEAHEVMRDLERHGYSIVHRIDEPRFFAFEAVRGSESTVRILTGRGPSFAIQTPDVRALHRTRVALDPSLRPDYDSDGQSDVVIEIHERDRTCLAWVAVDAEGFVSEVFRPAPEWGDAPCVTGIDRNRPSLVLEVSVPGEPDPLARVKIPVRAVARGWQIDESPSALEFWKRERERRRAAIEEASARDDQATIQRLSAELAWLTRLLDPEPPSDGGVREDEPVLEPAGDGEKAR